MGNYIDDDYFGSSYEFVDSDKVVRFVSNLAFGITISALLYVGIKLYSRANKIIPPTYTLNQLQKHYSTLTPFADQNRDGIHEFEGVTKDGTIDTLLSSYHNNDLLYVKK